MVVTLRQIIFFADIEPLYMDFLHNHDNDDGNDDGS
jgi:hypothetical protein